VQTRIPRGWVLIIMWVAPVGTKVQTRCKHGFHGVRVGYCPGPGQGTIKGRHIFSRRTHFFSRHTTFFFRGAFFFLPPGPFHPPKWIRARNHSKLKNEKPVHTPLFLKKVYFFNLFSCGRLYASLNWAGGRVRSRQYAGSTQLVEFYRLVNFKIIW